MKNFSGDSIAPRLPASATNSYINNVNSQTAVRPRCWFGIELTQLYLAEYVFNMHNPRSELRLDCWCLGRSFVDNEHGFSFFTSHSIMFSFISFPVKLTNKRLINNSVSYNNYEELLLVVVTLEID